MSKQMNKRVKQLAYAGMIAAAYVVLTWLSAMLGLEGKSAIQLRLSEALCILPYFTVAAVPGLTVGCLIANLLTAAALPDLVFGTLATLLGAIGTRLLRRHRFLAPLPPILSNTLIIPVVIKVSYVGVEEALPFLFFTVGVGEILSVGMLGTVLLLSLERRRHLLFPDDIS